MPDRHLGGPYRQLVSRAGWTYLRDSYQEAWETRTRTGETSVDLLIAALNRRNPPEGMPNPYHPPEVIRDIWIRGVEPRHLRRAIYGALPELLSRAVVAPWRAVFENFKGREG